MAGAAKTLIIVTVDGGLVQGVAATDANVVVGVIDFDVEGSDRELTEIPQDDGGAAEARCHIESVSIEPERVRQLGGILGMPVPPDFTAQADEIAGLLAAAADQEDITSELDDLVIDAFNGMSASINNGGHAAQIRFLLEQGDTKDDLLAKLLPPAVTSKVKP